MKDSSRPPGIAGIVLSHARLEPEAPALLAPDRAPLSYAALASHLTDVGATLASHGIARSDRVALLLADGAEAATAFLSVASYAICAPLNPAYGDKELDFYLSDLGAKAVIAPAGDTRRALDAARSRGIAVLELHPRLDAPAGVFTLSPGSRAGAPAEGARDDDLALVLHTSGTTARPKRVPLKHGNLCASARNVAATLGLTPADRCLNVMPLFHIHGLVAGVVASLAAGASVVCVPGFQAPRFFEWLDAFAPTWYTAVPTMHQTILSRAADLRGGVPHGRLRFIRSSSSPLPPQVMSDLEAAFGVPVVEAYGMTEAAHQVASNPLPPRQRKPGSVGLAAGPEIAIMDGTGRLLEPDAVGEVVLRGPGITSGYEDNPEANAKAFADGWFRTGDSSVRASSRWPAVPTPPTGGAVWLRAASRSMTSQAHTRPSCSSRTWRSGPRPWAHAWTARGLSTSSAWPSGRASPAAVSAAAGSGWVWVWVSALAWGSVLVSASALAWASGWDY